MFASSKAKFAIVIVAGIVGPGVLNYVISVPLGAPLLGRLVWILGYTAMVVVIWFYWLRPIDFRGPKGESESDDDAERKVKD